MFGKAFRGGRWPARIVSTALVGVGLSVGGLAIASPANATTCSGGICTDYVGVSGRDARCAASPYSGCLYWYGDRSTSGAYWGLSGTLNSDVGVADLNNVTFFSGTGAGAGVRVRNNAAGIACEPTAYICVSYVSPNYTGNEDILSSSQVGTLNLTWNNGASFEMGM